MKHKDWYALAGAGALGGVIANFLQTLDAIKLAEKSGSSLVCDISEAISCSNILNAPQAQLFGFPNSMLALVVFSALLMAAIIGYTGSKLTNGIRVALFYISVGMLAFASWFLLTSAYVIGALCLFCVISFTGLSLLTISFYQLLPAYSKIRKNLDRNQLGLYLLSFTILIVIGSLFYKLT